MKNLKLPKNLFTKTCGHGKVEGVLFDENLLAKDESVKDLFKEDRRKKERFDDPERVLRIIKEKGLFKKPA